MSAVVEEKIKEKGKKEAINGKKSLKKKYKLRDFYGCFKGKIFYDDYIFGFAI